MGGSGEKSSSGPFPFVVWLISTLALFFTIEALVFRVFYPAILEPESAAGMFELVLKTERTRKLHAGTEVLVMGDSLVSEGFSAKIANGCGKEAGWHFSSAAIPGSSPRIWYYLLRDLDPTASRYGIVVLPLHHYNDDGEDDDLRDRILDLHWAIARLRYSDLFDFPHSFPTPSNRASALSGLLWKGLIYKTDVQRFLRHPIARIEKVSLFNRNFDSWWYDYAGNPGSLEGLKADWNARTFTLPRPVAPELRYIIARALFEAPQLAKAAQMRTYRQLWLSRILDHYRSGSTRIVFLRMPASPLPHPVREAHDPASFLDAAIHARRSVSALDENLFAPLERPDLMFDGVHLNAPGRRKFSRTLAETLIRRD